MKVNAELLQRMVELKEEGLKQKEISKKISSELGEELSEQLVSYHLKKLYKNVKEVKDKVDIAKDELNDVFVDEKRYDLIEDNLVFYVKRTDTAGDKYQEKVSVPIELVSDIVYDYSRHGANLSGPLVVKKYGIKPMVWDQLKRRLQIYKDTNACPEVVLQYIEDKYGEEAVEEKIVEVSYRAIQDKHVEKYKNTYEDLFKKESKKALKTLANIDNFLEHLQEYIKTHKPIKLIGKIPEIKNNDTIDIGFSDIHLGKNGTDGVVSRIYKLTDYIIKRPEKNINLLFLGDLAESLVEGGMHAGQVEHMDGVFGFDLIMLVVGTLEQMLLTLHKAGKSVSFRGLAGNHDRLGKSHDQDQARTGAFIIFEMLKRGLSEIDIKVEAFHEKTNSVTLENFHYILNHGDEGFAKKAQVKPEDILWKNGVKSKQNIVMYGDRHNVHINETKGATCIGTPALAGQGTYDKRLDLHSEPGVIIIEKNADGLPDITLKRFK